MNNDNENDIIEELDDEDEKTAQHEELVAVETKAEDSHDDDEDDARMAEDNDDREEVRRRRREEKAERAQRRKEAIARDKAELDLLRRQNEDLRHRMSALETKSVSFEVSAIDQQLNEAIEDAKAVEHIIAQAVEAGNGADVAKAMRIRDETMARVNQLTHAKNAYTQNAAHQQQIRQNTPEPQIGHKLATDWIRANTWYDPNGGDERSKKVIEIDQSLTNEGYNPNSLTYWRELDKRVEAATAQPERKRGGPPVGSGREQAPRSSRNEVYISPERKNAMIEAGVWDDPVARQKYLKSYAKWDRDNNSTR